MRTITEIRVWTDKAKTEYRIYISFSDKSEGCYYKTGNAYKAKGLLENITEEEKNEAYKISCEFHKIKGWMSVRSYQMNPATSKIVNTKKTDNNQDEEDKDIKSRGFIGGKNTPDFEQCY